MPCYIRSPTCKNKNLIGNNHKTSNSKDIKNVFWNINNKSNLDIKTYKVVGMLETHQRGVLNSINAKRDILELKDGC